MMAAATAAAEIAAMIQRCAGRDSTSATTK